MPRHDRRSRGEQLIHDRALELIARERYSFTDRITYRNPNDRRAMSAGEVGGKDQYPDIVVVSKLRRALIICEVETESSVNEEEVSQWLDFSSLGIPFYLYIPRSKAEEAKRLIDSADLREKIKGLRTYELGRGEIFIDDIWDRA